MFTRNRSPGHRRPRRRRRTARHRPLRRAGRADLVLHRGPGPDRRRRPLAPTGSVVLTIDANRNWTGFRPGQHTQLTVEIDGVRHTRCYSMASAAATGGRRFQLGIKAHPEGLVSRHLVAHADGRHGRRPHPGRRRLPPPRRPSRARPARERRQRHHPGACRCCARCAPRATPARSPSCTTPLAPRRMLFRDEVAALAAAHGNVRVVTAFNEAPDAGDLTGFLDERAPRRRRSALARRRGLRLRPRPAHGQRARALRRRRRARPLPPGGVHPRRCSSARPGPAAAPSASAPATSPSRATAAPCSSRPRPPGSAPSTAAAWASATPAPARSPAAPSATPSPASSPSGTDVDIRICVSVPVGDVEIDL